ncbi:menaquinol-cytochrome C reductase [Paenibacillus swuensis]|uniref:Menaquinol-cytochrome C reductase n=1 Tax=Paenibacillus swuensis TaxID=1178515 RepID=A0A172TLP2_9BACL|nr:menaquinol-cytochrome c reductase cytochrome b/c subunit [Paenibacillus swuensis]ANE47950.1 menaquinol-cytochrome C reductase [Paenibacillus swuensis]
MAHGQGNNNEKVIYVGDSRVKKNPNTYIPPDYTSFPGKSEAFIPNFLLKEWMVGAVVLVGFLVLTIAEPAPLGYPANPLNGSFIPMPDWYFLFMYQLLKYPYTSEDYVVLGTLVVPGILFGGLTLAPFLDTGKERRFYRRPIASSLMFLSILATIYLTNVSWTHYQHELKASGVVPEHIEREMLAEEEAKKGGGGGETKKPAVVPIVAEDDPGAQLYAKASCVSCHGADLKGMPNAKIPALRGVGDLHDKDAIVDIIANGYNKMPAQKDALTAAGFSDQDIDALAEWLSKQKAPAAE